MENPRANPFLEMIGAGKILSVPSLKGFYRAAARETHPDRNPGGEGAFILLTAQYEEALAYLEGREGQQFAGSQTEPDHGKDFFYYWLEWENLMMPVNLTARNRARLERLPVLMESSFHSWMPGSGEIFQVAMEEYQRIREEKTPNDLAHLRQPLLRERLRPLVYDICRIGLGDRTVSRTHVRRTLEKRVAPPLLKRLQEEGYAGLFEFFLLIIRRLQTED
jgi:hypothetical protein